MVKITPSTPLPDMWPVSASDLVELDKIPPHLRFFYAGAIEASRTKDSKESKNSEQSNDSKQSNDSREPMSSPTSLRFAPHRAFALLKSERGSDDQKKKTSSSSPLTASNLRRLEHGPYVAMPDSKISEGFAEGFVAQLLAEDADSDTLSPPNQEVPQRSLHDELREAKSSIAPSEALSNESSTVGSEVSERAPVIITKGGPTVEKLSEALGNFFAKYGKTQGKPQVKPPFKPKAKCAGNPKPVQPEVIVAPFDAAPTATAISKPVDLGTIAGSTLKPKTTIVPLAETTTAATTAKPAEPKATAASLHGTATAAPNLKPVPPKTIAFPLIKPSTAVANPEPIQPQTAASLIAGNELANVAKRPLAPIKARERIQAAKLSTKFPCKYPSCLEGFDTSFGLKDHMNRVHEHCRTCDMDFDGFEAIHSHKLNTPDRHITCPKCSEDFKTFGGLNRHVYQVWRRSRLPLLPLMMVDASSTSELGLSWLWRKLSQSCGHD